MESKREHWSSSIGFVLAAAGSAIGLGTLWKFPYVTGENGGGLFVLMYIFCTLFVGIPIFIAELILGRRAQRGAVGVFSALSGNVAGASSFWKSAGWLGVISSFLIMSFYSVLAGWGLNYVFMSLGEFYKGLSPEQIASVYERLEASGDITLFWHFMFTALTVAVVLPGVRKGIEYWSKWITSALFVLLFALFLYGITLDGFSQAVDFVLKPDLSKFKASSALEALGLAFFTLSLGQGIMLTYGSYMSAKEDIPKTSLIVAGTVIFASLLAALTIFPVIFSFGFAPGSGPGLVFKTLPLLFSQLPGALILSTTFFILFVFCALTSAIALIEVVAANLMDLYGWSRARAVLLTGAACFIVGIPSALSGTDLLFANWKIIFGKTFFATIDGLVSIWLLPIGGLLISLYCGWVLPQSVGRQEFSAGSRLSWLFIPWLIFVRWLAPFAIVMIILQQSGLIDIDYMFRLKF